MQTGNLWGFFSFYAHLSLARHWFRSIAAARREAVKKPPAKPWKRKEGGGSEGGGRQQISVMFDEGGTSGYIDDNL